MLMNVQPIAAVSERINEVRALTARIVNKEILPNENLLWARPTNVRLTPEDVEQSRELRERVKVTVKQAGLWAPHLPVEYGGAGLDFLELAYMNEVLAYAVGAASLFGVVAPNSGNQTLLVKYGTRRAEAKVAHSTHRRHARVGLLDDRTGSAGLRSARTQDDREARR